ncbi:MAG TPA: alpha/beta fold hydrolase [Pyrinomonadaceae bacterium]|nr:alpha/beta fold hydrolase [Pyrinomonadaceae bacterium]
MFRRMFVAAALSLTLAVCSASVFSFQSPTPPSQPQTGPGGKQYLHAGVTKNRYGTGGKEYWIFEPDTPKPRSAPVVVFLHGWGGMNPLYYGAWVDHLVKRGNIVIYPRYQASLLTGIREFTPNTLNAVKDAISRLKNDAGHVRADFSKFATVGHSLGGVLAANVAALASESDLPRVSAVMAVEPGITESPINVPLADLKKLPPETLLLSVAGDQDTLVRDHDAKRIYYESTRIPANNKDFIMLVTDTYGTPALVASHRAPTAHDKAYDNGEGVGGGPAVAENPSRIGDTPQSSRRARLDSMMVNALDFYGTWKLFDALCDAAFYNKNREYALGNTPQQRFMGLWSDGKPVKELKVTDKP